MKKVIAFNLFFLTQFLFCNSQNTIIDSLKYVVKTTTQDSIKVNAYHQLFLELQNKN